MNNDIAISAKNVSKSFRMYNIPADRLKEILHPQKRQYHQTFQALNNVSFYVPKGTTLGILGSNGCGKSTLLQIISGILKPTSGSVQVNGRISALIELGAGFNRSFTGRENIFMQGAIMGVSRDEMEKRYERIAEFAEIGDFINQPVKIYSSGMYVRLAFATAINVDPDILVIDEALAVGDVFFRQKCYDRIREIQANGATCLFVSHDTGALTNLCSKAILLDKGIIDFEGDPREAVSRYYSKVGKRTPAANPEAAAVKTQIENNLMSAQNILDHNILRADNNRHGKGGLIVAGARVLDKSGQDTLTVRMLEALDFYILLRANQEIYDPSTGIHLYDRLGNLVFAAGTRQLGKRLPDLKSGEELVVKMTLTLNVQPGEYTFSLGCSEPSDEGPNIGFIQDRHEMLGPIFVTGDTNQIYPFYGIAQLPLKIEYQPSALLD